MKQQETQCWQNCQLRRHGFILCHLLSHFWRSCIQFPSSVLGCYLWRKMLMHCTSAGCLNATFFVRNYLAVARLHATAMRLDPLYVVCVSRIQFKDLVRTAQKTYCSSQIMQFGNIAATHSFGDWDRDNKECRVRTVECYREQSWLTDWLVRTVECYREQSWLTDWLVN
jgi:hypothetical protein